MNPWRILGVHRQSTPEEIQLAFHTIARRGHPDVTDSAKKNEAFIQANAAYSMLKDKKQTSDFIKAAIAMNRECGACKGKGATYKSIGMTKQEFKACPKCFGAGLIIKEEKRDVIELQSAGKAGGRRSYNERKAGADKRRKY